MVTFRELADTGSLGAPCMRHWDFSSIIADATEQG